MKSLLESDGMTDAEKDYLRQVIAAENAQKEDEMAATAIADGSCNDDVRSNNGSKRRRTSKPVDYAALDAELRRKQQSGEKE
jgi:hypothetical protein